MAKTRQAHQAQQQTRPTVPKTRFVTFTIRCFLFYFFDGVDSCQQAIHTTTVNAVVLSGIP